MLGMLGRDEKTNLVFLNPSRLYKSVPHAFPARMAKDKDPVEELPRVRLLEERPASLSEPVPHKKLNKDLQKIVDKEDDLWDSIYEGQYEIFRASCVAIGLRVRKSPEAKTPPIPASDMQPTQTEYER